MTEKRFFTFDPLLEGSLLESGGKALLKDSSSHSSSLSSRNAVNAIIEGDGNNVVSIVWPVAKATEIIHHGTKKKLFFRWTLGADVLLSTYRILPRTLLDFNTSSVSKHVPLSSSPAFLRKRNSLDVLCQAADLDDHSSRRNKSIQNVSEGVLHSADRFLAHNDERQQTTHTIGNPVYLQIANPEESNGHTTFPSPPSVKNPHQTPAIFCAVRPELKSSTIPSDSLGQNISSRNCFIPGTDDQTSHTLLPPRQPKTIDSASRTQEMVSQSVSIQQPQQSNITDLTTISSSNGNTCSICNKKFTQKGSLSVHMRTHTGEKPFVCQYCHKSFAQAGNMKKHVRIHTGKKPYICSACGKAFAQKCHLTRHNRTHTGEQPYACPDCDRRFSQKNALAGHIQRSTGTGDQAFACHVCSAEFTRKCKLLVHSRIHGDQYVESRQESNANPIKGRRSSSIKNGS